MDKCYKCYFEKGSFLKLTREDRFLCDVEMWRDKKFHSAHTKEPSGKKAEQK